MQRSHAGASGQLADLSQSFATQPLPPEALALCGRSWFDTVCVSAPGWQEPAARRARAYVAQQFGAGSETFRARLWDGHGTSSPEAAALLDGIAAHVLDFDDVSSPMRGHPSVALWPALMALADAFDLDGARLARAFVLGFEAICKISRGMALAHYAKGWHSTASIGTLGATLAASHLLALDREQTVNALGLAVAQSGGTRQNFGTDAKSFQAGMCGAAAVRSVLLARQGFTASPDAIDGPLGYLMLYADGASVPAGLDGRGGAPLELIDSGIDVKQYPLCYATHRTIDGVLALRRQHGLGLDDVERVDVLVSPGALAPLIHHRPATGLEAKFSMEYAVAAALADGEVRLRSFTDEAVQRPAIAAFLPRVEAVEARDGGLVPRYAEISVRLKKGPDLRLRVSTQHGAASDPLSQDELRAKGADCLRTAGRSADAAGLLDAALAMSTRPARRLLDALAQASR